MRISFVRRLCVPIVLLGILVCGDVIAQGDNRTERIRAASELVADLEHRLEKQSGLAARGFASAAEVDDTRAALFMARHDLASVKGDKEEMHRNDVALFEVRKRELRRFEKLRGRGHKSDLQFAKAQRRVAVCRYIVADNADEQEQGIGALKEAVQHCEQEVKLWTAAASRFHATRVELSLVLNRLVCGRNLLAREDGRPEEIAKQFQNAVDLLQADFDSIKQLRERGSSTIFEELYSQSSLLNAKVRLANAKGQHNAVKKHVQELVATHKQLLDILAKPTSMAYLPVNLKATLKSGIAKDWERDQRRLQALSLDKKIADDLSIATLGP